MPSRRAEERGNAETGGRRHRRVIDRRVSRGKIDRRAAVPDSAAECAIRCQRARNAAQRIHCAGLKAIEDRRLIADRIVEAFAAQSVVVAEVKRIDAALGDIGHRKQIDQEVVLTSETDRATRSGQTDIGLTSEQEATLSWRATVHSEAIFQYEDRLVAAAEIFGAAKAEATSLQHSTGLRNRTVAAFVIDVRETCIDDAV